MKAAGTISYNSPSTAPNSNQYYMVTVNDLRKAKLTLNIQDSSGADYDPGSNWNNLCGTNEPACGTINSGDATDNCPSTGTQAVAYDDVCFSILHQNADPGTYSLTIECFKCTADADCGYTARNIKRLFKYMISIKL